MKHFVHPFVLLFVLFCLTRGGYALTSNWTNGAGGNWSDSANWDNGVPGVTDTANISLSGTYTVTVDWPTNLETLLLGGASGTQTLFVVQRLYIASSAFCCQIGTHGYLDIAARLDITGAIGVLAMSNSGTVLSRGEFYPNIGIVRNEVGGLMQLSCSYTDSYGQSNVENYGTLESDECGSSFRIYLINYEVGTVTLAGDNVFTDIYNLGFMEVQSGSVLLQLGTPAFFLNTGTCMVRGDVQWKGYFPDQDPNFTNSGLLEIAADTSLANDNVIFEVHYYSGFDTFQTSNIRMTSGNMVFTDMGDTVTFDDSLYLAVGCTLNVAATRFADSLEVSGVGTIHFYAGFSTAEGHWPFGGGFYFTALANDTTSLQFNPSPPPAVSLSSVFMATASTSFLISNTDTITVGTLRQDGGTMSGNLIVQTIYEWTEGTFTADTTAGITILPGIALSVTGSGEKVLDSLHLNIEGMAVMQDSGVFTLVDSAVVNIAPGGSLLVGPAFTMSGVGTFYNSGETSFDPQGDTILIAVPVINSTVARTPGTIDLLTRPVVWGAEGFNGATIRIWAPGQLILDGLFVNAGQIEVQVGGELLVLGQLVMEGNSSIIGAGDFYNEGHIESQGGVMLSLTNIPVAPVVFNGDSGTVTVQADTLTLLAGGVNRGVVTIMPGAVLKVFGTFLNDTSGLIQGGGVLDVSEATFTNLGTISPGMSPGSLTIAGDLLLGPSSVLQLELNGASPGQHDHLNVSGAVQLNGTLALTVGGGYIPQETDSLQLLNCGTWSGDFQQISGNVLSNGIFLNLNFGPGGMVVSVIPGLEVVIRALSPGTQSVRLSWNAIPMATSYSIYSAATLAGPFTFLQTVAVPTTVLTIVRNAGDLKWYYRVTATLP